MKDMLLLTEQGDTQPLETGHDCLLPNPHLPTNHNHHPSPLTIIHVPSTTES